MTEPPDRLSTALSGRYRIERQLGEGGMATVYLAEDEKHDRKVALKVLKPELAAVIGADRFITEIKTTAQLQHPHILPLFDSGEADGFLYYVMPYIEGETLREKLDRETQLGVEESVRTARNVADALDYAHKQGVIHRDIKPENILLHEGRPVVADFGIALAISAAGGGRLTETGLSLGTPHYMSPEQATADRDLSPRSDVYSLGCVLYEMLAGDPPHTGPTAQAILMGILTETPRSVIELRRSVPPHVSAALAKAIEKLPADRFESAQAFIEALENESFSYTVRRTAAVPAATTAPPGGAERPTRSPLVAVLGIAALGFGALAAIGWLSSEETSPRVIRTDLYLGEVALAPGERIEVSPDGSTFAFVGVSEGQGMLYVRHADEPRFRPIPGTEGARNPSFSPGGDWLVYRDDPNASLLKVSISGGSPLTVVPRGDVNPWAPDWGDDGTIVFGGPTGPHRVPETGGTPERLPASGNPHLLPGGRGVLLTVATTRTDLVDLATDSVRTLIPEGVGAVYVPTGHILYVHPRGGLQAVAFDLERLEVTGQPVPVLDEVERRLRGSLISISEEGTLVYVTGRGLAGGTAAGQTLIVADLEGNISAPALEPRLWGDPRYSPDGRFVAYSSGDDDQNIFVYDIELGTAPRQLTFEGDNYDPVWSPDGSRIVFSSAREGTEDEDLFIKSVIDDSPEVRLLTWPQDQEPRAWPADDLLLFLSENASGTADDLWLLDPSVDGAEPVPYLESEATIRTAAVSHDGRFAAYDADESGERVVYVRSFPQPRQQSRVSAGPGRAPSWSPEGDAIYYFNCCTGESDTLFVARVQTDPSFAVLSTDVVLTGAYQGNTLDLHPDGDRLLIVGNQVAPATDAGTPVPERHIVVFNWFEELKERLGEDR
jgi:serine/threonine-protein kinase